MSAAVPLLPAPGSFRDPVPLPSHRRSLLATVESSHRRGRCCSRHFRQVGVRCSVGSWSQCDFPCHRPRRLCPSVFSELRPRLRLPITSHLLLPREGPHRVDHLNREGGRRLELCCSLKNRCKTRWNNLTPEKTCTIKAARARKKLLKTVADPKPLNPKP